MKTGIVALAFTLVVTVPTMAETGIYMGKAATGEAVYYRGVRAQCGDLPKSDRCWRNPMIWYTIGSDEVSAIPDCQKGVFKEVWVGGRQVAKNMRPQSEALRLVLKTGCNTVR